MTRDFEILFTPIFYHRMHFAIDPMFIEPTITWVPSGFSRYILLDTKIVLKKKETVLT